MKTLGLLVLCIGILSIFGIEGAVAMGPNNIGVPSIDVALLAKRLASDKPPFVLDVREPSEFQGGHIDGAKLMPLGTIPDHLSDIPKDKPVAVICHSGNRSAKATAYLMEHGYTNIENVSGGMSAWEVR